MVGRGGRGRVKRELKLISSVRFKSNVYKFTIRLADHNFIYKETNPIRKKIESKF
jgi:hypothetical protein